MNGAIKKRRSKQRAGYDPFFEIGESVALLEQATENNQRQIGELSANTNKAIGELALNTSNQFREVTVLIEKQGAQNASKIESLAEHFQASEKPNYLLWLGGLTVLFALISAAMWIISLSTENTIFKNLVPMQASIEANSAKEQVGVKDREELHSGVVQNRTNIEEVKSTQRVVDAKLTEIETQFRMSDHSINIRFAEQQRMNNILMQMTKSGVQYPLNPYYFPETTVAPSSR